VRNVTRLCLFIPGDVVKWYSSRLDRSKYECCKVKEACAGLDRPWGFQEVTASRFISRQSHH